MAYSISYIYEIIDKYTPALKRIGRMTEGFKDGIKKTSGALKKFGDQAGRLENAFAGLAAGAGLALVAGKAMDFEDVMTDVAKVVNFTSDDQFPQLREQIFKTSTELGKLPKDIAAIAVEGGKLGVLPEDMNDFIGVVSRTSVAFDMFEQTAAANIGSIKAKVGLTVQETGNLMDAVNYLADNTSAGGSRMIEVIARTAGNLAAFKMPTKFMAGWAAFADQMEVSPELAASGLNMMINRMKKMPGMVEKLVKDPNTAIKSVLEKLAGLDDVMRTKKVDELFGPEAGRFVLKAVNNIKLLDKTLGLVGDDAKYGGSMMRELEKKLKTASTATDKMRAVFDILMITIGDALLPTIKELGPKVVKAGLAFREWALAHPGIVKIGLAFMAITAALVPMLTVLGLMTPAILMIGGLIGGITIPIAVGILAFAAMAAAVYQIWSNWDLLVQDFYTDTAWMKELLNDLKDWWLEAFTFDFIVSGIENTVNAFNRMLNVVQPGLNWLAGVGAKVAGFLGLGGEGVAAANGAATQGNINGQITVAPAKGAEIKGATMDTNLPGNLGFNIAGVIP